MICVKVAGERRRTGTGPSSSSALYKGDAAAVDTGGKCDAAQMWSWVEDAAINVLQWKTVNKSLFHVSSSGGH